MPFTAAPARLQLHAVRTAHCAAVVAGSILVCVGSWVRRMTLVAAFVAVGIPPAGAATGLTVSLTPDQPVVTIDRDRPADTPLLFEVVVTNDGGDLVPGVVVHVGLPGGAVERQVGDLAPGAEWREVLRSTLASTARGGPLESTVTARSSDGREASSVARTEVQVISSAVVVRDEEPTPAAAPVPTSTPAPAAVTTVAATEVLGATYERPAPGSLAATGGPVVALATAGVALVLSGGALVRRTADDG